MVDIPGRANSIVVSWRRKARKGDVTVLALGQDEFDVLSDCLDVAGPAFLSLPSTHWPAYGRFAYVTAGAVTEVALGNGGAAWKVTFPLTSVDRPTWVQATSLRWFDPESLWGQTPGSWDL